MTINWTKFLGFLAFMVAAGLSFFQKPLSAMMFFQLGLYLNLVARITEGTK